MHFVLVRYSSVQDICLVACGLWLVSIDTKLAYAFRAQEIWLVSFVVFEKIKQNKKHFEVCYRIRVKTEKTLLALVFPGYSITGIRSLGKVCVTGTLPPLNFLLCVSDSRALFLRQGACVSFS
jgi:hypothetical protein